MKKTLLIILLVWIHFNMGFSQEVVHPFSTGGTCLPKVDAFIKKGLNANTCAEMKNWADGLAAMQSGECGRVFNFAKLSTSGNRTALDVIGNQIAEKHQRLKCDDRDSGNDGGSGGGNSEQVSSQSSANESNNALWLSASSWQQLANVMNQREADRQRMVTDDKGPNKYSFLDNVDQRKLRGDVLVLNNNTELKVVILKINEEQVSYKKAAMPDGPSFVVKLKNIKKIIFENGDVVVLDK
jgi:hypothetical protein